LMVMMWLFPLFPATPKLGPVYQHITHMVPLEFPLLIIVPAFLLDLIRTRIAAWAKWAQAAALGVVFLAAFLAVQWPFADFLISPASANRVFGTKYFAYFASPNGFDVRHLFFPIERTPAQFWLVMAEAFALSILSARLGMSWGEWVRKIRR
jgi:hypothetical protein